jgi:ribose 5-phosphate isomerase B
MIIIGSDHTGVELKENIIEYLKKEKLNYIDVTKENEDGDDYPDIAVSICEKVLENNKNLGIAICGTGIGISIACNKINNIRAAMCTDEYMAEMSRRHNNANVLCLGARLNCSKNMNNVKKIVQAFINSFYDAGRHERRIMKINAIEKMNTKEGN